MREIKFRFWNKEKKTMCYKNEDNSSSYWDGVDCSEVEIINSTLNSSFTREEYEIMQYTGLKDKNGKEIYEGDIVKVFALGEYINGYIKYNQRKARFDVGWISEVEKYKNNGFVGSCSTVDNEYDLLEVVGNIYDNSDAGGKR